ncbi:unnamed protein product [Moneuplotes crassus]|uniref:Uncharacterized protein n=1 Tax=Euplotes crassus TaxID=5936 RepID=A0AAD1UFG7_EUPCR|nr:unnamed protein product [Moneuplotes crassus]
MSSIERRNTAGLVLFAMFQGLIIIPNLPFMTYLYDDLGLTPGQLSIFNGFINYVWAFKVVFGFVVDCVYILGYRRKSNLLIATAACTIGWICMGFWVEGLVAAIIAKLSINISIGIINTVAEALMVEMTISKNIENTSQKEIPNQEETSSNPISTESKSNKNKYQQLNEADHENKSSDDLSQNLEGNNISTTCEENFTKKSKQHQANAAGFVSIFLGATYLFSMLGIWLGGFLKGKWSNQLIFKVSATISIVPLVTAFVFYEKRKVPVVIPESYERRGGYCRYFKRVFRILWKYLKQGFIFKPTVFMFLVLLTPSIDSVMFTFQTDVLKFSYQFMSNISLATFVVNILAVIVYRKFLLHVSLRKLITVTTVLFSLAQAMKLIIIFQLNSKIGISNKVFFIINQCFFSFINEIHLMPLMVMATRICPKNLEATVYEFIMSVINLAYLVSYQSGGAISELLDIRKGNYDNLWIQIIITSVFPLLVLWVVFIVPNDFAEKVEKFSQKVAAEKED